MTIKRTVRRVIDGDTFEVYRKVQGSRFIRLAGINAPEWDIISGRQATLKLKRLVEGKTVTLIPRARSHNRIIGYIRQKRRSVNKRLK